jgi:hypothetical protein
MIIKETTLTGTEEELLAYFKTKYNLVETNVATLPTAVATLPTAVSTKDSKKPVSVQNKVTTGIGNLFGGTSWGN